MWLGGSGRAFKAFWAAMGGGDKRPKRPQRLSNRWDDFVAEWDEGEEEPLSPSPPPKGSPKAAGQQEQPGSPAAGGRAGSRKRKRSSDSPSADADPLLPLNMERENKSRAVRDACALLEQLMGQAAGCSDSGGGGGAGGSGGTGGAGAPSDEGVPGCSSVAQAIPTDKW